MLSILRHNDNDENIYSNKVWNQSAYNCKESDNYPWSNLFRIRSLITSPIWSVTTLTSRDYLFWESNYDSSRHASQRAIIISKGNNEYSTMMIISKNTTSPKGTKNYHHPRIFNGRAHMPPWILSSYDDWAHLLIARRRPATKMRQSRNMAIPKWNIG